MLDRSRIVATRKPASEGADISTLTLEGRSGWSLPRLATRPINLERRARFARYDLSAPAPIPEAPRDGAAPPF